MTRQFKVTGLMLLISSTCFAQVPINKTAINGNTKQENLSFSGEVNKVPDSAKRMIANTEMQNLSAVISPVVSTLNIKIQSNTGSISSIVKPTGIAFRKNYNPPVNSMLYITDEQNKKVYYVNSLTNYGKLFATQVNQPYDIIFFYNGRAEITDNDRISEFTEGIGYVQPSYPYLTGTITTGFLNGNKYSTRFNNLKGIVKDSASGIIYVADYNNNMIRKIYNQSPINLVTATLAGSGNASFADGLGGAASFNGPVGIAVDSKGNVIVADKLNNRIRKITPAGLVTTIAGNGNTGDVNGPGLNASFNHPTDVVLDKYDNIYVADYDNNLIRKIDQFNRVTTYAGTGQAGNRDGKYNEAQFNKPLSLAIDVTNNTIYVTDFQNGVVRKIVQ